MTSPPFEGAASSADGPRFAVVGAYVIDCIARTDRMPDWGESYQGESVHMAPGGKALNMAVALARMGAHVDAVGVVGDDLAGQTVVEALVREGVGIGGLEVRPGGRTPICMCFSRTDGETSFLWRIDDSVSMDASMIHGFGRAVLTAADATIVTFESPAVVSAAITLAKHHGSLVALQPAPSTSLLDLHALPWDHVDLLVPNEREAHSLLSGMHANAADREQLAGALAATTGVVTVAVTLGADGVLVCGSGNACRYDAMTIGDLTDTVGASDAFTAALTRWLVGGAELEDAIQTAQEFTSSLLHHRGRSENALPGTG